MLFEVSCGIEETNLSGLTGNEQAGGDLTEEVTFDLDLDTGILAVVVSLVDLWTVLCSMSVGAEKGKRGEEIRLVGLSGSSREGGKPCKLWALILQVDGSGDGTGLPCRKTIRAAT